MRLPSQDTPPLQDPAKPVIEVLLKADDKLLTLTAEKDGKNPSRFTS